MAALGWLLNLGFAGGSVAVPPVVEDTPPGLSGGKPEKKKRRKSLYPDVDLPILALPKIEKAEDSTEVIKLDQPDTELSPLDREIQGYFMEMGLIDQSRIDRIIADNEQIDRKRRQNFAAIALLLLD